MIDKPPNIGGIADKTLHGQAGPLCAICCLRPLFREETSAAALSPASTSRSPQERVSYGGPRIRKRLSPVDAASGL
jgi:hypothetical protein